MSWYELIVFDTSASQSYSVISYCVILLFFLSFFVVLYSYVISFSVCVCVLLRWPAWWTFVFSDNLPQCCVLIELLYCGLIKFFFFFVPFPRQTAISVESRKIFRPRVFCAPAEGVLLGIGYLRSEFKKTRMKGLNGRRKKFDDIFIRLDTMYQSDRRMDGRTPGGSKDRAYA